MTFTTGLRRLASAAAAAAFLLAAPHAFAQDIAESHLKAARAAVDAINATDDFDDILPAIAKTIKSDLIQQNPDLQALILQTVDEQAILMVPRRVDLEKEIALAYARSFSEADLNTIATFYNSETGKKLLANGPIVTRETNKAVEIWERGIARDLALAVGQKLETIVGAMAPADPASLLPGGATTGTTTGTSTSQ
ncbi:MAG: DUF2059 domain-containing protein [Rhizobiaceae bacterium]|nr:DUF2059 domain-containing protein [Rhizobiaceae bacterium]